MFAKNKKRAIEQYRLFVSAGKHELSPWQGLKNQIYLGSDKFVEKMQRKISRKKDVDVDVDVNEYLAAQRRQVPKYQKKYPERDVAITIAYKNGGYSMKEISDYF